MKLRLAGEGQSEADDLDMTPLIDVIFLLVLFFMFTSSFIEEAKVFKIVLPKAEQPTTVPRDQADVVSRTIDGELYFQDASGQTQLASLSELVDRLKERREARPVIVRCDGRCEYQEFMQIKNALKLAEVDTIFEEVAAPTQETP